MLLNTSVLFFFFFFFFFLMIRRPPRSTLFLHDALPISRLAGTGPADVDGGGPRRRARPRSETRPRRRRRKSLERRARRSEEHTSELQSQFHLVCRLLLEKKKKTKNKPNN